MKCFCKGGSKVLSDLCQINNGLLWITDKTKTKIVLLWILPFFVLGGLVYVEVKCYLLYFVVKVKSYPFIFCCLMEKIELLVCCFVLLCYLMWTFSETRIESLDMCVLYLTVSVTNYDQSDFFCNSLFYFVLFIERPAHYTVQPGLLWDRGILLLWVHYNHIKSFF